MRLSSLVPRRLLLLVAAGHAVLLVALVVGPRLMSFARGPSSETPSLEKLDVYGTVPQFSLTERSGCVVSRDDLRGNVWVANFIYTKCTETCPTQSLQVARLQAEFAGAPDLRLVSITVDPRNDTREVLTTYAERYSADRQRWLFLTGDKREIYCLAKDMNLSVVDPSDPTPPACGAPAARAIDWIFAHVQPPAAVPVRVSVDHPMDPDHFIESLDLILEADPVPRKGTFRFTPASGRARLAFPMRSGSGGLLKAIATCNRHGRFVGTREIRVGGDGCATESDGPRARPGNPRIRVVGTPKRGEVVEVAVKLDHESDTGLRLEDGKYTRVRPEYFVREMQVFLGNQRISDFRLTSALSSNAILRLPVRVPGASTLRVVVVNSEGRRWDATEPIRVDA